MIVGTVIEIVIEGKNKVKYVFSETKHFYFLGTMIGGITESKKIQTSAVMRRAMGGTATVTSPTTKLLFVDLRPTSQKLM